VTKENPISRTRLFQKNLRKSLLKIMKQLVILLVISKGTFFKDIALENAFFVLIFVQFIYFF